MDNKEFVELSEKEVKMLNGSDNEDSFEAWRGGYNYARNYVNECLKTCTMDECLTKLEDFCENNLEEFKFNM